jgi:hypothetical protein
MADVVAISGAFASTDGLREIWDVTAEVAVGTALLNGTRAGVAYTPSGGHVISTVVGPLTISGFNDGGTGLGLLKVSAATDGTYEFTVTGATAATANGTLIYAVVAAGLITSLTTTVGSNTLWGVVNNPSDYDTPGAFSCVKIGV